jgi:hypothetical protein
LQLRDLAKGLKTRVEIASLSKIDQSRRITILAVRERHTITNGGAHPITLISVLHVLVYYDERCTENVVIHVPFEAVVVGATGGAAADPMTYRSILSVI